MQAVLVWVGSGDAVGIVPVEHIAALHRDA